jgi:hypothetical protein
MDGSAARLAVLVPVLGLLGALAACEADGGRSGDPVYVTTCDVRDPDCATAVFQAVARLYGTAHPRIRQVVPHGEPATEPQSYDGHEWWAPWMPDGFPLVDDPIGWEGAEPPADPSLAADPLPEPLGVTLERGDGRHVELVYAYPAEGPLAGADDGLARRRRLGLVAGTLRSLRAAIEPGHPLDDPAHALDGPTRRALRTALAHEALLRLEGQAAGEDAFERARGALDALGDGVLDDDVTPGRAPWEDGLRATAFRWVATRRADAADGRALAAALWDGPRCARQLLVAAAACYDLEPSAAYEQDEAGFHVRGTYRFTPDELWTDVLRPAGEGDAVRTAARELAFHFGAVWLRLGDGALVREDLFLFPSEAPAETLRAALERLGGERIGPATDRPAGSGQHFGPAGDWQAIVEREGALVRVVQGPPDTDLAPFLGHLEALRVAPLTAEDTP